MEDPMINVQESFGRYDRNIYIRSSNKETDVYVFKFDNNYGVVFYKNKNNFEEEFDANVETVEFLSDLYYRTIEIFPYLKHVSTKDEAYDILGKIEELNGRN